MHLDQLKPNIVVRAAIFPEPVQVMVVVPRGESVKLIGKGLTSGKAHEPSLNAVQLASLESTPREGAIRWGPTHIEAGNRNAAVQYRNLPDDGVYEQNDEGRAALRALLEPFVLNLAQGAPQLVEELWEVLGLPAERFSAALANF